MSRGRVSKIETSVHKKFILDCLEQGLSVLKIRKLLLNRGMSVSVPTLRAFANKVREEGINVAQMKERETSTAMAIHDKLKDIPQLASVFGRRNFLIDTLLDRRGKLLEFANEGNRTEILISYLKKLKEHIKNKDLSSANNDIEVITNYVKRNFKDYRPQVDLEHVIRAYTMDIHNICKYVEQWTSIYEVNELLKKVCKDLTKVAVECFGPMLKKETPEYRDKCIQKFISSADKLMDDIREDEINFGAKKHEIKE